MIDETLHIRGLDSRLIASRRNMNEWILNKSEPILNHMHELYLLFGRLRCVVAPTVIQPFYL